MIEFTDSAQEFLLKLLNDQKDDVVGVRIFITNPGTPKAETCISYCREDDPQDDDETRPLKGFDAYIELRSLPFLEEAFVDYAKDKMGGQLTIKAPNSKTPKLGDNSTLEDRITYVLYNEVNPMLASHGGEVNLVEVFEGEIAVLQFGGGCQGCGMVDMTLKDGVEKTLLEQVPELKAVRDVTDHTVADNAYYK